MRGSLICKPLPLERLKLAFLLALRTLKEFCSMVMMGRILRPALTMVLRALDAFRYQVRRNFSWAKLLAQSGTHHE
jgi:hypothetical protein